MEEITMLLMSSGVDVEPLKSRLIILLDKYDVDSRCTEVAVVNEDDITKYIRLFLISKRVSGRTDRTIKHYKAELERFFREVQKKMSICLLQIIILYLSLKILQLFHG